MDILCEVSYEIVTIKTAHAVASKFIEKAIPVVGNRCVKSA
jgi:hypothetical protein